MWRPKLLVLFQVFGSFHSPGFFDLYRFSPKRGSRRSHRRQYGYGTKNRATLGESLKTEGLEHSIILKHQHTFIRTLINSVVGVFCLCMFFLGSRTTDPNWESELRESWTFWRPTNEWPTSENPSDGILYSMLPKISKWLHTDSSFLNVPWSCKKRVRK